MLRGHKSNFFQPQCTWFCLDSPHLCRVSESSSWGTLTHPPKPNANVPLRQKPSLILGGRDGSSLLFPSQSGHSSIQVLNQVH